MLKLAFNVPKMVFKFYEMDTWFGCGITQLRWFHFIIWTLLFLTNWQRKCWVIVRLVIKTVNFHLRFESQLCGNITQPICYSRNFDQSDGSHLCWLERGWMKFGKGIVDMLQKKTIMSLKSDMIMNTLVDSPPASEASRGVYWNQAQKNFTHPYTEYPWVSVTL